MFLTREQASLQAVRTTLTQTCWPASRFRLPPNPHNYPFLLLHHLLFVCAYTPVRVLSLPRDLDQTLAGNMEDVAPRGLGSACWGEDVGGDEYTWWVFFFAGNKSR